MADEQQPIEDGPSSPAHKPVYDISGLPARSAPGGYNTYGNVVTLNWTLHDVRLRFSGHQIDFAPLVKVYRSSSDQEQRYSPGEVAECIPIPICGSPVRERICTSHIERQNLTMRMQMRRLTRLTNAFSKKRSNLNAALALHFAYYNFCRIHSSLRLTPAMEAGITDHVWTIAELLA